MRVDQTRHDPASGGVYRLDPVGVRRIYVRGQLSDGFDPVTGNRQGNVFDRRIAGAIDQRSALDDKRFIPICTHAISPDVRMSVRSPA